MARMFNVLYDFVGLTPYMQPYIGAGVGYQEEQISGLRLVTPGGFALNTGTSSKGDFAYQGIVGAAFPMSPALALTIDYRFMGITDDRTYGATVVTPAGAPIPAGVKLSSNYNNIVLVGLRYAFNVPPPPMAPAPAVVAPSPISRSYLVFFDWDKADLTDRARQIVSEAAANSTKVQYTQIEVNGYTDTSGTPQVQPGPVRKACQGGRGGTGEGRRAGERDRDPGLRRDSPAGSDRPGRSRAAEPARRNHYQVDSPSRQILEQKDWGAFGGPFSFGKRHMLRACPRPVPL